MPIDLHTVADRVRRWCNSVAVSDAPYGTYRFTQNGEPSFYASADIAMLRWMIGEDLKALDDEKRTQWADVINSYQSPVDGHYGPEMNHHVMHANGTAVKSLSALGKQYRYPVGFYRLFNTPERIGPWLSQINWTNSWGASHLVKGGPAMWMNSTRATEEWKVACFMWFDDQLNEYGSWPRDFYYDHSNPITPIGCAVHVWPLYRHTGREVPGLELLADCVLDWQNPMGYWDAVGRFGTLDALYALSVAITEDLPRKSLYQDALYRYIPVHFALGEAPWVTFNAHRVLGWAGCIGYLQRGLPDEFTGDIRWGDIFDLKEIYDLDTVLGDHPV